MCLNPGSGCIHVKVDQTVFVALDNRKLFFDPVLDSAAAARPAPLLAPLLGDAVLPPQPTDLQAAGEIIQNAVKKRWWWRRRVFGL